MTVRRLGFLAVRTAVFVVVAWILAVTTGWSMPAAVAVALTTAALVVQLAGMVWLRHRTQGSVTQNSAKH
ncbi:hypothetical protein DFQ14_102343 [Halopolyspora algeriensis]|uniref:Uncharacterized protein n=1 Tax=Halopolyspora algeriensis TaxID=1500506 RepID=A0A368W0D5_9ACTN|nr:hypothetical protein [Halopolyspora algeriensis]RCW46041.1 hypothetical protein DFQ14_102343 [Halopolyspora algeriensis]TQM55453.1 hypothetical protein FHU43_0217 [Halopolyspora algeriensis]